MDSTVIRMSDIIKYINQDSYIFLGICILFVFLLGYSYLISKRTKKLRQKIDTTLKSFQKAFEVSSDAVLILSNKNKIIYANKAMVTLLALEKNYKLVTLENMPKVQIKQKWLDLDTFINEAQNKEKVKIYPKTNLKIFNKSEIVVNLHLDTLLEASKKNSYYHIIVMQDLTQVNLSTNMAYTHRLTNLPNQMQAIQDLPALYSKIHTENNKVALVLLSFDNFSRLRAIIGYEQSNEIIIKFSKYLKTIATDMNLLVYHTFDNHFLLTVSNVNSKDSIIPLVEDIQIRLASFYKMEEASLHLTVSAGVALYPESGPTRKLLDNTYKALSQSQKEGDGKITIYMPKASTEEYDELTLHNDMQSGLDNGEFEVYYQPIIQTTTKETVGAEALIRWIHPKLGFIPPDVFIGLMEKTGFIIKLGQFVLDEVLKQQKRWELFKFKQIQVSINVSMVEIATGEFVEHVKKKIAYHQGNPELLKFEITEGVAMIGEKQTEKYFHRLKKLGVGISLDDFGTGYTSFTYLKKFPADILKIDKSLVDYILTSEEDRRIVKAIIELGHNLGMKIVVEGIETKEMVTVLASYGCDYMQGYYFSRPLPVFEFQKLLR